jgi:menaquinone-dependent protoporphyrinogen oxidase
MDHMNVLVAHASKHGSTREIAEAVAGVLRDAGLTVDCVAAGEVGELAGYDAVVLGSAVYMGRWQADARHVLRRHAAELAERPLWIFSSGPVGEPQPDEEHSRWLEPRRVVARAERLGVRDHVVFGGRAEPDSRMERDTPSAYRDRRDWEAIRAWAAAIATELQAVRT